MPVYYNQDDELQRFIKDKINKGGYSLYEFLNFMYMNNVTSYDDPYYKQYKDLVDSVIVKFSDYKPSDLVDKIANI